MRMPKERYIGLSFFSGELKPRQRKPYAIVMTMGEKKALAALQKALQDYTQTD